MAFAGIYTHHKTKIRSRPLIKFVGGILKFYQYSETDTKTLVSARASLSGETLSLECNSHRLRDISAMILASKLWPEHQVEAASDIIKLADCEFLGLFIKLMQQSETLDLSEYYDRDKGDLCYTICSDCDLLKDQSVLKALEQPLQLEPYTPRRLKEHQGFVRLAVKRNPGSIKFASDKVLRHPDFIKSMREDLPPHQRDRVMILLSQRV